MEEFLVMNEKISLGEYLKDTRREKGISIDEIARETNISKRYLEALEGNQFETFPGDTYILGFLATYSEALELDRDHVLSMYRRQMRIEQDAPLEELVGTQKKPVFTINPRLLGIVGGSVLGLLLLIVIVSNISKNQEKSSTPARPAAVFNYDQLQIMTISTQVFVAGDIINITNKNIQIGLQKISSGKTLEFLINKKKFSLKEGGVFSADTDNNDINDMSFEVFQVDREGIKISLSLLNESEMQKPESGPDIIGLYKDSVLTETELYTVDIKEKAKVAIEIVGTIWLEYQLDNQEPKQAEYNRGQSLNLEFNDALVLLLANAGAAEIKANGLEEKGGSWGEANKSIFYWKNNNGKFTLVRAMLK